MNKTGQVIDVSAKESAADALIANGFHVDLKCADGLCGVCQCQYSAGEVEHRDFILSNKMRQTNLILCQSRAAQKNDIIEIDLNS